MDLPKVFVSVFVARVKPKGFAPYEVNTIKKKKTTTVSIKRFRTIDLRCKLIIKRLNSAHSNEITELLEQARQTCRP